MKKLSIYLFAIISIFLLTGCETNMVVFNPQGPNAETILGLINWSLLWMAIVIIVVMGMFITFIWKYRERPDNMDYEPPEEHGNTKWEIIWTAIPFLIVIALLIPNIQALYALEEVPEGYEDKEPITIHVTGADWKWIFSYPEEDIETVNYVNIPEDTPIIFKMTSAGTMQSFWVPALGGQKYAMAKMETELILTADNPGSYMGKNSNFNGPGYAEMEFEVLAQTQAEYDEWVEEVKERAPELTEEKYIELLKPTHLGRLTFNGTHLQWINHADPNSNSYTNPQLYYREHGYKGKTFDEEDNYKNADEMIENEHGGDSHHEH
ncbi:cytochrome aa3 quinol oxidase subunit II [Aquibacillus sediminis]|uniref:cytochrome aa3 quinol oxidase subunit II n=1 Tax=Aquibacillus sediminis TaxID=2574734 RepID=UPI001109C071|nr:cytochrome aa3 quinol oxidase subunit II [Aquibacillus sediminis]